MFDFQGLFAEIGEHITTSGKNVIPGNVNIRCPFCSDQSNHLNCNPDKETVFCWKCGNHSLWDLLDTIGTKARAYYLEKYRQGKKTKARYPGTKAVAAACKMPSTEPELNPRACQYLKSRGFDPVELQQLYDIRSTGPIGAHKFRVIIPVYYRDQVVSFVGRDYTGRQQLRYKTAGREEEAVHHKSILYGLDACEDLDTVVVVEGIMDAWRLGPGSVATFGTTVTAAQINVLVGLQKSIVVLFDNEPEAQQKAKELQAALQLLGCRVERIELPEGVKDPGELSPRAVQKLRASVWETERTEK